MSMQVEPGFPYVKTFRGGKMVDFKETAARLTANLSFIIPDIVPGGELSGREYKAASILGGKGKSFSINIETGVWKDFATNQAGGDVISLYAEINNLSQLDSAKQLSERYLSDTPKITINYPTTKKKPAAALIKPPPEAARPQFGDDVESVYEYKDTDGSLMFYIVRRKNKVFNPYCFSTDGKWVSRAWTGLRPIYNLHLLSDKPVLIVEGEKSADAANQLTNRYTAVSWPGGAQASAKVDWSPLYGRRILLWPDADKPGIEAMNSIYSLLRDHCPEIKIINTDKTDGWDAADALSEGWTQSRFIEWAKPLAKSLEVGSKPLTLETINHTIESLYGTFPHQTGKSLRPLATIENFKYLMDQYGVVIRYNVITKDEEVIIPGKSFIVDNRANASVSWIISTMAKHGMSTGGVNDFIAYMLGTNLYNPVTTWITSKPWDGQHRLDDLYNTITLVPGSDEQESAQRETLKKVLMKRWLISAVAAAFNPAGISAHGVLTFQGDQNIGKTSWLKSLVPSDLRLVNDGVILRPDDKDSVKQACSFWLIELGELDATFKKSDIAQLKAFLTKDKDVLRRAFAKRDSEYARRTVFFSSVNPKAFLQDPTGNRRFWTIECASINYNHCINMQQLWAEVYEDLYKNGETWYLNSNEIEMLNIHNEDFTTMDEITENILEKLDWDMDQKTWVPRTATQVLEMVGCKNYGKGGTSKAGQVISKRNGGLNKKRNGVKRWLVPMLRSEYAKTDEFGRQVIP